MKIEDLDTPVLTVDAAAFERNIARMSALAADAGIACRPHAKATNPRMSRSCKWPPAPSACAAPGSARPR